MSKTSTAMIAPDEAKATRPKLSFSEALLSFFNLDIPTERANIKGTAIIPVVAPEASKAIARNSRDANIASRKIKKYIASKNLYKGMIKILKKPRDKIIARPIETTISIIIPGI